MCRTDPQLCRIYITLFALTCVTVKYDNCKLKLNEFVAGLNSILVNLGRFLSARV